jgi:solute carrier family 25 phosphate transporter 23/24/25/41
MQLTRVCAEFRTFVHETEKELLVLFKSIDYNNDGRISKPELRAALSRAGLAVPNRSLDTFFTEVDTNNDGTITFDEWRYVYT